MATAATGVSAAPGFAPCDWAGLDIVRGIRDGFWGGGWWVDRGWYTHKIYG